MSFPNMKQLELFYWNDDSGDMDMYVTDFCYDELEDVDYIQIGVTYPEGEELAVIRYNTMCLDDPEESWTKIYTKIKNIDMETGFCDSWYILYDKNLGINRIDDFLRRESAFDM